jgi:DNA modification methylase
MSGDIVLIHGDCLVEMQRIPDKSIDVAIEVLKEKTKNESKVVKKAKKRG